MLGWLGKAHVPAKGKACATDNEAKSRRRQPSWVGTRWTHVGHGWRDRYTCAHRGVNGCVGKCRLGMLSRRRDAKARFKALVAGNRQGSQASASTRPSGLADDAEMEAWVVDIS